jgi:hypothetical protein
VTYGNFSAFFSMQDSKQHRGNAVYTKNKITGCSAAENSRASNGYSESRTAVVAKTQQAVCLRTANGFSAVKL